MMLTYEGSNNAVKPNMPVLFISGEMDPIGKGNGVKKVVENYNKSGYKNISVKLYPEARHELFNELNRDSVTEELTMWIDDSIEKISQAAQQ
jgi:alpha-beta hydrolase superfamily lysophospholipase